MYDMVDDVEEILAAANGDIDQRVLVGEKTGMLVKSSGLPNQTPITYLTETEQLHYLFSNNEGMTIERDVEATPSQAESVPLGTHSPTSKYNALLLVTSERLLYLIGKNNETLNVSVALDDVTSVSADSGILYRKLTATDGTNRYVFRTGRRADISAATEYLEERVAEMAAERQQDAQTEDDSDGIYDTFSTKANQLTPFADDLEDQLQELMACYEEPTTLASTEECTREAVRRDIATVSRVHTALTADIEADAVSQPVGEEALAALQTVLTSLSAVQEALVLLSSAEPDDEEVRDKLERAIEAIDETPITAETLVQHRDALTEETDPEESTTTRQNELLDEVRRLNDELGKIPHHGDMREHARFDPTPYYNHFDDWTGVLKTADIDVERRLITDLQRANETVSGRLTAIKYDEYGTYTSEQIGNYFGSWDAAVEEAALEQTAPDVSGEALLSEFETLADALGKTPTEADISDHSRYDLSTFLWHFESLEEVAARLHRKPEVREALERVVGQLDSTPTISKFEDLTEYSANDVLDHFDSWTAAMEAVGSTESLLIEDLQTANELVSGRLTTTEYDEHGTYTSARIRDYFGSWDEGLEAAGLTVSKERLLTEFSAAVEELGKVPDGTELQEHTPYSVNTYTRRIGSLKTIAEEAGLNYERRMNDALREAAAELGHPPTTTEFNRVSEYAIYDVTRQYDSWSDAIEAVDFSGVLEDDPMPTSNPLAEYYEAFSNLHRLQQALVDETLEAELSDSDPTANWMQDIGLMISSGRTESEPGYGPQQNDRNLHTMEEYREAYGTGRGVTRFECIQTKAPPAVVVQPALDHETDSSDWQTPADPEEGTPLPVVVETNAELARARELLDRFPVRPAAADDVGGGVSNESEGDTDEANSSDQTSVDTLREINPVDSSTAEALVSAGFQSREALQEADVEGLADVEGVSTGRARRIKMSVGG